MPTDERLLTIEAAAQVLGTSKGWLYRHHPDRPFTVWLSQRQLRFSLRGMTRYMAEKSGKGFVLERLEPLGEEVPDAGPRL